MGTTTNLGMTLQTTGSNSGTWGSVLNTNVITVLDNALGSTTSVNAAGNSNITLTSAQAGSLIHDITGALTGNIQYIFPSGSGRIVAINNATSGSYTVTVIASGGTGVVVKQGTKQIVLLDSSNNTAYNLGGLLAANNLSDVASASTSLSNIGGAPLSNPTFSGGTLSMNATSSGGIVSLNANNAATGATTYALFEATTGTSNSALQLLLNDNNGSPNAQIYIGTAVSGLSLPNPTTTTTQTQTDSSTKVATTAFVNGVAKGSQVYTSGSGNFTVPSGATSSNQFKITLTGGGGGGGGANGGNAPGGGAGTTAIYFVSGLTAGATCAYSVGGAGTAGGTGGTAGGSGGNTTITVGSTTVTAPGGNYGGGVSGTSFAVPGAPSSAATNATISILGGGGGHGGYNTAGQANFSGHGGSSFWGGGGSSIDGPTTGNGNTGAYGSGGSGGAGNTGTASGGVGGTGIILIEWW